MTTLGLAFVCVWGLMDRKMARIANRKFNHKRFWLTTLLLLSNLGVALACIVGGIYLFRRTFVEVWNETGAPIDACTIEFNPASKIAVGPIPPGGHVRKVISGGMDLSIKLDLVQGPNHVETDVIGYASGPPGVHQRVHVRPGLKTDIEDLH